MIRSIKKIPVVLTEKEQEDLLKQPNKRYPTGERNHLIMQLMLNTGLRLSELTNLKWKDLNLLSGRLWVRNGKNSKDRCSFISEEDLKLFQDWKERQTLEIGEGCNYVFTTLKGTKLSNRYIQGMVERYNRKANIDKRISPHTLRHTFATDLYKETKNIRLVQKALGHSDLSTTMIYTHIVDEDLEDALRNFRTG